MTFDFTHYLCNVDLVLISIFMFWAPKSSYNIAKRLILQIKNGEEEGDNKTNKQTNKKQTETSRFHSQEKSFLKNGLLSPQY